jgi:hypothetical protein
MNFKKWKPKCNKEIYLTYGKIFKVSLFHLLFVLDIFIPSFRLLTYIGYKFKHIEIFRITIKEDREWKKNI